MTVGTIMGSKMGGLECLPKSTIHSQLGIWTIVIAYNPKV